ncbi:MAG: hypothetical protein R2695_06630 [Acidimicrobiales bacterium]
MKIAKLNVDEAPEIARRFQVMSIPTMTCSRTARRRPASSGPSRSRLLDDVAAHL